jgi:predicted nuclease of restriction endonuclease-like (RecB) superfamily
VVGRKDRGRERKEKKKKEEKSASDKLEFLSVHAPHIHESDAEIKLNQPWNDFLLLLESVVYVVRRQWSG